MRCGRKRPWFVLGLLGAACVSGPEAVPRAPSLLDLVGDHRGTLQILGAGSTREVAMRLLVEPVPDRPQELRWLLGYGDDDLRDYRLCIDDAAGGRCHIDERNGIELQATFRGGELVAVFVAGGQTIVTRYRLVPAGVEFSLEAFAASDGVATGQGVTTIGPVALQRALLRRQPARR